MRLPHAARSILSLLVFLGTLPLLPTMAWAQTTVTVDGTVLLPAATAPGVPRREYLASGGTINGVNGYVFAVELTTVGTFFTLQPATSNTGVGDLDIYFYSDFQNGVTCNEAASSGNESGVVCGTHAIVVLSTGANVTFQYQAGLPVPAEPPFQPSQFKFGSGMPLLPSVGDGEPSIAIQPGGPIYVVAPAGCALNGDDSNQCIALWRSTDNGATFSQPAPAAFIADRPIGGGDSEIAVDHLGRVYAGDLMTLTSVAVWRSFDQGSHWLQTLTAPCADREWIAAGGPNAPTGPNTLYETNHDCSGAGLLAFWRSVDAGTTFLNVSYVASDLSQLGFMVDTQNNNVEAQLKVDQVSGTVYVLWATAAVQDGTNQTLRLVLLGRSQDGGATWRNFLVYTGPPGSSVLNLFPVLAVDRAGKLYAAWSTNLDGHYGVYISSSTDRGEHWTAPTRVSSSIQTAIFPWIAAGADGRVDLVWLGTDAASPDSPDAQWNVFFGQSKKAFASPSRWSVGQVSQNVMHRGDICRQGLACLLGGNRSLLDFISVDVDADGMANVVWTDDHSRPDLGKLIMFGKQVGGPGVGHSGPNM